jgi:predicted membrane protein
MKKIALLKLLKKVLTDMSVNNLSVIAGVSLTAKTASIDTNKACIVLLLTIIISMWINAIIMKNNNTNNKANKNKKSKIKTESYSSMRKEFVRKLRLLLSKNK